MIFTQDIVDDSDLKRLPKTVENQRLRQAAVKILPCTRTRANYTKNRIGGDDMECIYSLSNCNCCKGIENPIYPCKWEEDNYMNIIENSYRHKKRVKHHKGNYLSRGYIRNVNKVYKKHLKFLADNIPGYPSPVVYTDKIWIKGQGWVDNPKPYYKRCYRGRGRHSKSNYHKKMSNRKIRRFKGELPKKGNLSHRLYDFWWKLY